MSSIRTPYEILELAKYCQPLAANDVSNDIFLKGGSLDRTLAMKIYMERKGVQWVYDKDPNNSVLRNYSNYLFRFLGKYVVQADQSQSNQQQSPPQVSGPANQTINMSGTASFSLTITSALPITSIVWYKNNVIVPGETGSTYSYAANFSNNGDTVKAIVTNAAGSTSSTTATLTVTNIYTAYFHFGDSDEYANILAGIDNLTYQFNTTMTPAASTFNFTISPEAGNNRWQVIKYPTAWGNVNAYFSTNFNNGAVPSSEYYALATIGSNTFVCSRKDLSFDPNFPLVFSRP